jgi:hypothetical protein
MIKPFTAEQQYYIERGNKLAESLKGSVGRALGVAKSKIEVKRHAYICSPPGAGKTFTVQAAADAAKIQLVKVHGAASMNYFVTAIACAALIADGKDVVVWVDDCDSLFMETENLNVMKGAMDEERNVLAWGKNMTAQINTYEKSEHPGDQLKAQALRAFQPEGSVGLEVPTNKIRFIVTSNKMLTPPNSDLKTSKKMHEAAIRDRVNYVEFDIDGNESWGWVASVFLNNDIFKDKAHKLTKAQKHVLLDWMYTNWKRLPATSMRAVKDYAAMMINHPSDYPDHWSLTLRKG